MSLWDRIKRFTFKTQSPVHIENNVNRHNIQLSVYEHNYEGGPTALVRYTVYGEDGKPVSVQQISYKDNDTGHQELDLHATAALELGADVTIFTKYELSMFPLLSQVANY